ncbi:MAG: HU family DNA-binding protein [Patescibacteria group bacterium]|jgi:DNA-binding protein HU-beta
MNKAELSLKLSERLDIPKKLAEDLIENFEQLVVQALVAGDEVTIAGFGTFSARTRSARMGVNPRNPTEKIRVPEVRVPKFKAGKGLKDALKKTNMSKSAPVANAS